MAESNAATQLTSGELDLLEDALELCEAPGFEPSAEMSPKVVTRLDDYREILVLTREALTLEDVPAGLLDGVLAEANAAAPGPVVPTLAADSWWTRLRRSLVLPGVAVVATAVVVLVLVQPQGAHAPEASLDKIDARVTQQAAPAPGAAAGDNVKADAPDAADQAKAEQREDPESEFAEEKSAERKQDYGVAKELDSGANTMRAPSEPRRASKKSADPAPAPASTGLVDDKKNTVGPLDLEKDEIKTTLDQADAARRAGNCTKAKPLYEQIKQASGYYGSRAAAGLGLCAYRGGHHSQADGYFASARASSDSIQAWIDTEMAQLEREALNSKSKRARSKKTSKKQSVPQQADAL